MLVSTGITSLDGYVADATGAFDWAMPPEDVHAFVNDLERPVGTYLYGRRMYEVMQFWETAHLLPDAPPVVRDFAEVWQAADKVVFSTTLESVPTARTRVEGSFDPDTVRTLVDAAPTDVSIAGPGLAAHAYHAGLVDEVRLFVVPVVVGGGTRFLPDGLRLDLDLVEERRFSEGFVYLRYARRS
ncbi:dihydrofolate reductase family protein [Cellulomonas fimi]|uniref:Bifunctional deaminase-reductase domain protein n=1 Tax=Cellulomonas fimi (strain ATCC 484 / DSM 20113 / JCM 1341 / CCUG 24087 / LMG 16345 / NBRC 15513 / NCIMB 8980 / NCTC 7547 / NRS-133) TaxID=590998 RepID=F4H867_CELFA|nr:dihydrofolate reductase family protein [Cellulomonas fimi]AEE44624.1 bifunctional deaminase-reductase domain protein [Cellulomonas fimi ATCC 484]NNH08777.1 deaminase [Cellulomonas fimi]VEH26816.1 RibD C-terminal domain [Cellulomonas fimi]